MEKESCKNGKSCCICGCLNKFLNIIIKLLVIVVLVMVVCHGFRMHRFMNKYHGNFMSSSCGQVNLDSKVAPKPLKK